jgi:hypothetical protein
MRATADLGTKNGTSTVIAIRGQRLALVRIRLSGRDQRPEAFHTEMLGIAEINADNRMAARVLFDLDDFDAAIKELDARYLDGEAAAHSHTWSVVTQTYAALNRREMPATTPDWENSDHRRGTAFATGNLTAYISASWDLIPDGRIYIETVHGLNDLGAVVTHVGYGTSDEGFDAEWRMIELLTVEGESISRCELFDESDIDAALARFDELSRPAPRLENAASQAYERYWTCFVARDWAATAEILADDISTDDRRRVVNVGLRQGRDAVIAEVSALAEVGVTNVTSDVTATRGGRLVLSRVRLSIRDREAEAFHTEVFAVVAVDAAERMVAVIMFDLDDIDAAFEELDARYLAREAAAHARTWSVVAGAYAALNRHELAATTPDWVYVDHRRLAMIEAGDLTASIRAAWELTPDLTLYIEAVHQLNNLGAVFSSCARDHARGTRRRVARDRNYDGRRRSAQPLRDIRRDRA